MKRAIPAFVVCIVLSSCMTTNTPLPSSVEVITEADAQSRGCQFVDVVSAMRFAITGTASATARTALRVALEDAEQRGANAAVITSQSADNNQHMVNLRAYRCTS